MSMIKTEYNVMSSDKKHTLAGHIYIPDVPGGEIKGLFHVVHGMCEHIGRYDEFMRKIADEGYICFGYDNLGHGRTVSDDELGYIAHKEGYKRLAEDVGVYSAAVRKDFGGNLPYYLMGHSMGSFIVRYASENYVKPDKLIIMGTGGKNPAAGVGIALVDVMMLFKGERYVSKFVDNMAFGSFGKKFPENESNSWLTKDAGIREKYRSDKYCSFKFSLAAMKDLMTLNRATNSKAWFDGFDKKTPVLLISGEDDPVGDYGAGVKKVYDELSSRGCIVKMKLYPNCRHEILNDTSREECTKDIINFIK